MTKTMAEHEYGYKLRLLRILRALVESPNKYTKKGLQAAFNVKKDAINSDFEALKNAGFILRFDEKYRYALVEDKPLKQLKHLLHFTEEDQMLLAKVIQQVAATERQGERLQAKLASLYDYRRLGYAYLRKPYLAKLDQLEDAQKGQYQVILKRYYSTNSNEITDRNVEPFHIDPPNDMLQAYDLNKKDIRHFRISRISRIETDRLPWQFAHLHRVQTTDPFRIMDNNQVMVHLRLKVGAYNEMIERYPNTKAYIVEDEQEGLYDFQCRVNHQFYGLSNFILGSHNHIEVLKPEILISHLQNEVKKMKNKWGVSG